MADVVWFRGVPHEAPRGVGKQCHEEEEGEMVRVPKRLEALGPDGVMRRGIPVRANKGIKKFSNGVRYDLGSDKITNRLHEWDASSVRLT